MKYEPIYVLLESSTAEVGRKTDLLVPAELVACRKVLFPDFGITLPKAPSGSAADPEVRQYISALAAALTVHAEREYPEILRFVSDDKLSERISDKLSKEWDAGSDIDLRPLFSQAG